MESCNKIEYFSTYIGKDSAPWHITDSSLQSIPDYANLCEKENSVITEVATHMDDILQSRMKDAFSNVCPYEDSEKCTSIDKFWNHVISEIWQSLNLIYNNGTVKEDNTYIRFIEEDSSDCEEDFSEDEYAELTNLGKLLYKYGYTGRYTGRSTFVTTSSTSERIFDDLYNQIIKERGSQHIDEIDKIFHKFRLKLFREDKGFLALKKQSLSQLHLQYIPYMLDIGNQNVAAILPYLLTAYIVNYKKRNLLFGRNQSLLCYIFGNIENPSDTSYTEKGDHIIMIPTEDHILKLSTCFSLAGFNGKHQYNSLQPEFTAMTRTNTYTCYSSNWVEQEELIGKIFCMCRDIILKYSELLGDISVDMVESLRYMALHVTTMKYELPINAEFNGAMSPFFWISDNHWLNSMNQTHNQS